MDAALPKDLNEAAAVIAVLMAENAAIRAERDELRQAFEVLHQELRQELREAQERADRYEAREAEQLTPRDAAVFAGRTAACIRQWCAAGLGTRTKDGRWVITRAQLREFLIAQHGADLLPHGLRAA
jgi:hypothetical protein